MTQPPHLNGFYSEPGGLRDGYPVMRPIDIQRRREELARRLEIERLRRCIHRCDEAPVEGMGAQ